MSELKSKHILFIQPNLEGVGGIEKVVPTAAEELQRRCHQVSVAIFYNTVSASQTFWSQKFVFSEQETKGALHRLLKVWKRLRFLQRAITTAQPDVVIVSAQGTSIITLLGLKLGLFSVPVILYVHEGVDVSGPAYRQLIKILYQYATSLIAVSKGLKNELVSKLNLDESNVAVAYNAIGTENKHIESEFDFGGYQKPYFVTASRIEKIKGVESLINHFLTYLQSHGGTLFVLGSGSLEKELQKNVAESGMTNRIIWLGYRSDVRSFISKCDAYVSLAPSEPFGLALLESLSVGVPVVATDVPYGPREILAPNLVEDIVLYPYQTNFGILCSSQPDNMEFTSALQTVVKGKGTFSSEELSARAGEFSVGNQVDSIEAVINATI